jgi:hypothetical protein
MEQWHGVYVHLAGLELDPLGVEAGVVRQAAMRQFCTFGKAGSA